MTRAAWDAVEDRKYETGVDHGLLFPMINGEYTKGVPWNGLTTVTESPSGAEATPVYADNIKYLNLLSAEEFAATIEALTYPPEFEQCDGTQELTPGVYLGQQDRVPFGFYYRTIVGSASNPRAGFKHKFVYGCLAAPSERAHATVNDSPEATPLSWELSTSPLDVGTINGKTYNPSATLTVDSTKTDATALAALLDIVYGTAGQDPRMPTPLEVYTVIAASAVVVNLQNVANQPSYNATTKVITLPAVTGVQWKINGVNKAPGAQPALTTGQVAQVTATPLSGYSLKGDTDWTYEF